MSFRRAGYSKMAVDHGNVHIVTNKAAWTAKLEEAKNSDKVVSIHLLRHSLGMPQIICLLLSLCI